MLPDSDEVNLSPAELQILSELDRSVAFNWIFLLINSANAYVCLIKIMIFVYLQPTIRFFTTQ